jgi:thymidylate synthase (FAD)
MPGFYKKIKNNWFYEVNEKNFIELESTFDNEAHLNEKLNITKKWLNQVNDSYSAYLYLRKNKFKPEEARSILPNCVKTEINSTFNLRIWRHIFKERTDLNLKA